MNEEEPPEGHTHWFTRLPPQARQVLIGCTILFVGWLAFMQAVPRTLTALSPRPPVPAPVQAATPKSAAPAPEIRKPPAAAPVSAPVVLVAPTPPAAPAPAPAPAPDKTAISLEALQGKVAEQSQAIASLQKQQEHALQTIALLDAYDRLKEAVLSGHPYADELNRLRLLAGNAPAVAAPLKTLEGNAGCGIAPLDTLTRDFPLAARRALQPPAEGSGVVAYLESGLAGVISIRRVGDVPGDTSEAIIARAETDLDHQRVQQAVDELSTLKEPALGTMKPWMLQAKAYALRDGALAALHTAILSP